ncbi:MAG: class I SAM-dependent methyltransferase [Acidobacteriota bacterium]
MFTYGDTTWGITVEERVPVVLHELCWQEEDVGGKVILDAGCGNGTLSKALADRGATVVAVDLSASVVRAHEHCGSEGPHFVQGNLFYPPFKPGAFDAIYSCGVFHHTPDPRRCFRSAAPLLKNRADARFFVWLYSKRSPLFNATVERLMTLTRRMPSWLLVPTCRTLAPLVEGLSRLFTRFGVVSYAPRTLRDRAIQLHDLLSPRFVWYQDFEEARRWATELGFERVEQTDYTLRSGGPGELRTILQNYRTVCRPGFGMLCRGRAARRSPDAS